MDHVQDGVFFTHPGELPRGRHELAREVVLEQQRERLMIAVTEQMADLGYRAVGVREIASHARISRAAFYECFPDKDDCVFAAYDRFIAVLLDRVVGSVETVTTWDATVAAVVDAYLASLESDLVVARAFQVEMDALGRPARVKRREALGAMALLLKTRRDETWPSAQDLPLSAYLGAVYAVRQMSADLIDSEAVPDLAALGVQARGWLARLLAEPTASTAR